MDVGANSREMLRGTDQMLTHGNDWKNLFVDAKTSN